MRSQKQSPGALGLRVGRVGSDPPLLGGPTKFSLTPDPALVGVGQWGGVSPLIPKFSLSVCRLIILLIQREGFFLVVHFQFKMFLRTYRPQESFELQPLS